MPLRLEIKKKLTSRSERVKCVDLHPNQPLVLAALYSGSLMIWNYETQTLLKSFEATTQPIRCAKFITRKQWIVAGSDDMMLRLYNFNTLEKVAEFEAHMDYIRSLEVHPTLPYILSASDDMQIKLWDWDKLQLANLGSKKTVDLSSNSQTFDGHAHYIMCIKFNPKDTNTFATASLDRTIKVWSLGSPLPNYSLEGHEQGVNAVDYFLGGEKPYLISGADDLTIKIWDYQTKSCVHTLSGHTGNVSSVIYHPKLPLIVSASEDGTVRLWHSVTYRLETTLNYGMERAWCVAAGRESSRVAIAFDEGTVVLALGSDEVLASMESVNGKALLVKNNEISQVNVRKRLSDGEIVDGETLSLDKKDLGTCEIYPQAIMHNSNGRFVALVGDGEYIIYTSQALRNKAFGQCLDLAWSSESTGDYALLKNNKLVQIVRNFDDKKGFEKRMGFAVEKLQGGPLLAMIFGSGEFVVFVDWESGLVVRKIDVSCSKIVWNHSGTLVALIGADPESDGVFILSCDQEKIGSKLQELLAKNVDPEEDLSDEFEDCFDLMNEISDPIDNGVWVGDCFLYVNKQGTKLNYHINGENVTLANLDRRMFLLNYVAKENRVYLIDQQQEIVSFELLESVLQYQTAVVRKDFDLANQVLANVPQNKMDDIARFLEGQNYKEVALELAQDVDLKFSLAISVEKLDVAFSIMNQAMEESKKRDDGFGMDFSEEQEMKSKWRQLCDLALAKADLVMAEECAVNGADLSSLFLIYTSFNDKRKLSNLVQMALEKNQLNIAFSAAFMIGDVDSCLNSLLKADRYAEASFFARSYCPTRLEECVSGWKQQLLKNPHNQTISETIASSSDIRMFPNLGDDLSRFSASQEELANLQLKPGRFYGNPEASIPTSSTPATSIPMTPPPVTSLPDPEEKEIPSKVVAEQTMPFPLEREEEEDPIPAAEINGDLAPAEGIESLKEDTEDEYAETGGEVNHSEDEDLPFDEEDMGLDDDDDLVDWS